MESDFGSSSDGTRAREILSALDADGARLAQKVTTPGWYHPVLGALVALMVLGVAVPGAAGFGLLALSIVGVALLVRAYTERTGVWISRPAGPVTRRLQRVHTAVSAVLLAAALGLRLTEASLGWALLPAVLGALVTVVLGRAHDRALRRELGAPGTVP